VSGLRIFESPLTFRIEFVGGEINAWIDLYLFSSLSAADGESWGAIKSLFP
jgi:hypothetical protein